MNWRDLPPHVRATIEAACTEKQLDAWKLSLEGAGARTIALALDISRQSARERLNGARSNIAKALYPDDQEPE